MGMYWGLGRLAQTAGGGVETMGILAWRARQVIAFRPRLFGPLLPDPKMGMCSTTLPSSIFRTSVKRWFPNPHLDGRVDGRSTPLAAFSGAPQGASRRGSFAHQGWGCGGHEGARGLQFEQESGRWPVIGPEFVAVGSSSLHTRAQLSCRH